MISSSILKSKISNLPKKPGVYKFLNKDGGIIYIGKAKNLRSRVGQYFQGSDERPQIPYLMEEAADFDYTVVNNELESLYLESTLIKTYRPKYNIMLRDDKNYAFIKIDYSTQIPQIGYARKIEDTSTKLISKINSNTAAPTNYKLPPTTYFGPYTAAYKIRNTLNLVRKIFPYCSAAKVGSRPCFYYYLHRCPGVCIGKITLGEYKLQLNKITDFLNGHIGTISKDIKAEMSIAAKHKKFETAARLRDQLRALTLLEEKQVVILPRKVDWDIASLFTDQGYACVNLFKVRGGKLFDKENFVYETAVKDLDQTKILETFLENYYLEAASVPGDIYIPSKIENESAIKQLVLKRFHKSIKIILPQKGKIKNLIRLGRANAEEYLKKWLSDKAGNLDKINTALDGLKDILNLPQRPERIECYDISNTQGTNPVGSMVVFVKGLPAKSQYRKFKIVGKNTPDDFGMMKEMLGRRLARSSKKQVTSDKLQVTSGEHKEWPLPDLIVIDGGKGQLGVASSIIHNSKFKIPVIGLAKRIEEIFVPGKTEPILLSQDNPSLQLLQRLRDEAHRFGITFHRQLRSKQATKSALDDISGIGPKTKKLLKTKFGTVAEIKKATFEQLAEIVGDKLAKKIIKSL